MHLYLYLCIYSTIYLFAISIVIYLFHRVALQAGPPGLHMVSLPIVVYGNVYKIPTQDDVIL